MVVVPVSPYIQWAVQDQCVHQPVWMYSTVHTHEPDTMQVCNAVMFPPNSPEFSQSPCDVALWNLVSYVIFLNFWHTSCDPGMDECFVCCQDSVNSPCTRAPGSIPLSNGAPCSQGACFDVCTHKSVQIYVVMTCCNLYNSSRPVTWLCVIITGYVHTRPRYHLQNMDSNNQSGCKYRWWEATI